MQYCVIVSINRNQLSFYYQQQGCKVMSLEYNGVHSHPLYFYSDNQNFSFGTYAKQQFLNGNPNAYGNYFGEIAHPIKSFNYYSNEKQIKYLLYHAVESVLNYFLNTVLYETKPIESFRIHFPLRFIFDSDIQEKEKIAIIQLFSEAGFQNFEALSLDPFLFEEIIAAYAELNDQNTYVKVQSLNGILYLQYFEFDFTIPKYTKAFPSLGTDPRLRITAELLYNKSIANTRVVLEEEQEIFNLIDVAKQFLDSESFLPSGTITLSDGSESFVRLKKSEINQKLSYLGFENKLYQAIDGFFDAFEIQQNQNLTMILVGVEVNTTYFIGKLSNRYTNIVPVRPIMLANALQKLVFVIEQSNYKLHSIVPEIPGLKQQNSKIFSLPDLPVIAKTVKASLDRVLDTSELISRNTKKPHLPPLPEAVKKVVINRIIPPPIPGVKKKNK